MTENYIVLIEQPLLMNVVKLADSKMKGKAIRDVMEWCPSEKVCLLAYLFILVWQFFILLDYPFTIFCYMQHQRQ